MPESPKDPIELLIQGRAHELGPGFPVRRVLPSVKRRTVGPFIFLDHFGPTTANARTRLDAINGSHADASMMPKSASPVATASTA